MPKLSFPCALPVGTESLCETTDIELYNPVSTGVLKERLNNQLPDGIDISDVTNITCNSKNLIIKESHYHIDISDLVIEKQDLDSFINVNYFGVVKRTKKGEKEIDARKMVKNIRFSPDNNIELEIIHSEGPELKPVQIITEIFNIDPDNIAKIKILKVKQVTG